MNKKILNKKIGEQVSNILGEFKRWPDLYRKIKESMVLTGNSIFTIAFGETKLINIHLKDRDTLKLFDDYVLKNKEFNHHFQKYLFTTLEGNIIEYDDGYDFFYRPNKNRDLIVFNLRDTCDGLNAISQESATYRRCFFDLEREELFIDRPDLFFKQQYTLINNSNVEIDWDLIEMFSGFRAFYVS